MGTKSGAHASHWLPPGLEASFVLWTLPWRIGCWVFHQLVVPVEGSTPPKGACSADA